jgi:surface protein
MLYKSSANTPSIDEVFVSINGDSSPKTHIKEKYMQLRNKFWRPALAAVASASMLAGGALTLATTSPAGATTSGIVLTVDTSAANSVGTTVSLPLYGNGLDATIDWGDGSAAVTDTTPGNLSYTYATEGTYTITVTGNVPEFGAPSGTAPVADYALTAVTNWDGVGLTSLYNAFSGDSNLVSVPTDLPSTVTETGYMFSGATSFNQNLNTWDTTSVTDMSGMFEGDTAFDDAGVALVSAPGIGWDTTNVTDMDDMFDGDTAFNQDLGTWNISKVSNLADALDSTTMSTANFDATLAGWADEVVVPYVTLGAAGLTYDNYGQAAFDTLTASPDYWTINDAGEVATVATPLTVTTLSGTVGTPLTLATTGGSGLGTITFTASNGTATGCVINGDELTVTTAGTCTVTATEAATTTTAAVSSAPTTIEFALATTTIPAPLTLGFAPKSHTLGSGDRRAITALSNKLEAGATVTVTGYAQHNSTLARERANAAAALLRADGVTVRVVISGQVANKVVITTTAQ